MNKVILIGRLTKKPETREIGEKATKVASATIAVQRQKDQADFINLLFWDKKAEIVEKYLDKGSKVMIEGKLNIDSYEDKNKQTQYITRVIVDTIEFLDTAKKEEATNNNKQ